MQENSTIMQYDHRHKIIYVTVMTTATQYKIFWMILIIAAKLIHMAGVTYGAMQ